MIPPDDPIAQEILRSIRQLVRGISIHSKTLLRDVGLTVPQVVCLRAIYELEAAGGGVTVAQVSQRVHLSAATVSRIVDRLAGAGLVIRERSRTDRRKVSMSLTPAGLERVQALPTPLQETFLRRLDELPVDDRVALLTSLRRIVNLMSAGELDAAPLLAPGEDVKP
ncbi:MAG TPA: MarR family transcriptional regulator [Kofleriaceae bacterium]|nr:MarR family transcriptional regulator [Kofleriaceae bacterium]